jgi:hypothetical protein
MKEARSERHALAADMSSIATPILAREIDKEHEIKCSTWGERTYLVTTAGGHGRKIYYEKRCCTNTAMRWARLGDLIEGFGTLARATTTSPRSRLLPQIRLDYSMHTGPYDTLQPSPT